MIIFNTKKLYGGQRLGKRLIQGGVATDHPAYGLEDTIALEDLSDPNIQDDDVIKDPATGLKDPQDAHWYLKSTIKNHVEKGPGLQAGWPRTRNPLSREDAISAGVENPQYDNTAFTAHLMDTIEDAMMYETQADTYRMRGPEIDQEIRDYVNSNGLDNREIIINLAIHRAQRNGERWRDYVDRVKEQQESSKMYREDGRPFLSDDEEEEDDEGFDVNRTPDSDEEEEDDDFDNFDEEDERRLENTLRRNDQLETDIHEFLIERGISPSHLTSRLYDEAFSAALSRSSLDEREENWRNDIQRFFNTRVEPDPFARLIPDQMRNELTFAPPGGAPPPSPPQGSTAASRRRPREDDGEGPDTSRPRVGRGLTGGKLKIKKPKHLKSIVHTIAHDIAKPVGEDLGKGFGPVNPFLLGYDLGYKVIGPAILKSTGGGGRGGKFRG